METCVRVLAEHAGDKDDPQDTRWKMVFVCVLEGTVLKAQECFGYTTEIDEHGHVDKWPFRMLPPTGERGGQLDFGPGGKEDRHVKINLFERNIEVGSLFTGGIDEEASTYRIVGITPLT